MFLCSTRFLRSMFICLLYSGSDALQSCDDWQIMDLLCVFNLSMFQFVVYFVLAVFLNVELICWLLSVNWIKQFSHCIARAIHGSEQALLWS
jgi:hypothetical protein